MELIGKAGRGVVILIRESPSVNLSARLRATAEDPAGDPYSGNLREIGIGSQILRELGVRDMVVLSNTERAIIGLEGYGLTIAGFQPISESDD
jgi:3,4-dihydroxy 2-butanone 4-phosphate synthase/GTP cyclohydrolase II